MPGLGHYLHLDTDSIGTFDTFLQAYNAFEWKYAPLHEFKYPCAAAVLYLACVIAYKLSTKKDAGGSKKTPVTRDLKGVQMVHNIILSGGSLIMLLGAIFEACRRSKAHSGFSWLLCEDPMMTASGPLYFWSYIYYLSKYYELLDTVITLIRGRPPPHFVLHVYHHACVLFMTWAWLEYLTSLQFLGLMFNTSVHVVMYYYYLVRLVWGPPWWKSFVTLFQIVQFMTSVGLFALTAKKIWVDGDRCAGVTSLGWTMAFNLTMLYEFVQVYLSNSRKKVQKDHTA
ncbi:unnamed protein product [Heterosigma akashiwo]